MERSNLTVALDQSNNGSLIDWPARAIFAALGFVFVAFLAANIGFVNLDNLVLPPNPPGRFPSRIASRMRCIMNQDVL